MPTPRRSVAPSAANRCAGPTCWPSSSARGSRAVATRESPPMAMRTDMPGASVDAAQRRGALVVTALAALLAASLLAAVPAAAQQTVEVSPAGPVRTVAAAVRLAQPGARIVVHAGVYREPTILVD